MPVVIPNGGGGDITSSELTAVAAARRAVTDAGSGGQSATESAVDAEAQAKIDAISSGWTDTPSVDPAEVLTRAARFQDDLALTVRQWAKPGRERALMEMFGVLLNELTTRDREMLELRARLDGSPY